jgi:hypothetical protein
MRAQDKDLLSEYGEAMLYSHLIEDLLKLILRDAAFFHVNGYQAPAAKPWKLEEIIDEFGRAFPDTGSLVEDLHRLRKIRNKLTHAFVPQVGSDLLTEEGRDQIHAMLDRYVRHAANRRKILGATFEGVLKKVVATDFTRIFDREEEVFDARVAKSDIQKLLDELDAKKG